MPFKGVTVGSPLPREGRGPTFPRGPILLVNPEVAAYVQLDHPISSCVSWRTDWHPLCPPSFQASEARGQGCRMWGQGQQEVKARRGGRKPSGFSLARHFAPHSSGLDLPHLLCPLPLVLCLSHRASPLTELFLPRSPPSFSEPTPLLLPLVSPSLSLSVASPSGELPSLLSS